MAACFDEEQLLVSLWTPFVYLCFHDLDEAMAARSRLTDRVEQRLLLRQRAWRSVLSRYRRSSATSRARNLGGGPRLGATEHAFGPEEFVHQRTATLSRSAFWMLAQEGATAAVSGVVLPWAALVSPCEEEPSSALPRAVAATVTATADPTSCHDATCSSASLLTSGHVCAADSRADLRSRGRTRTGRARP